MYKKVSEMTVDEYYKYRDIQQEVVRKVLFEREKQMDKWGHQRHDPTIWMSILTEEVGEAFQAINSTLFSGKETDPDNLKEELIQVAAVAIAIIEQLEEDEELPLRYEGSN